jgi:ADP-heptose:LPS heptosyltransferase
LKDFEDTAALCNLMDLVITVDTSVAHLSAALGNPTWTLIPYSPDWRWMLHRNESPWYESMRLYRQQNPGQWTECLASLAADVIQRLPQAAPVSGAESQLKIAA